MANEPLPTRHPAQLLRELSSHVSYELEMPVAIGTRLIDQPLPEDPVCFNAQLESFLLHLRQLFHFFYRDFTERSYKTDAFASDYLPLWAEIRGDAPALLEALSDDASKYGMHITTHRLKQQHHQVQQAGAGLLRTARKFLAAVDADIFASRPNIDLEPGWARDQTGAAMAVTTTATVVKDVIKAVG
jgi:hypothetical protein